MSQRVKIASKMGLCVFLCVSVLLRELLKLSVLIPNEDLEVNSLAINLFLKIGRIEIVKQPGIV